MRCFAAFSLMGALAALGAQQTGPLTPTGERFLLWPRFEAEVLAPVFPEGVSAGLGRFWAEAEPNLRQKILELFQEFSSNPNKADELRRRAIDLFGPSSRSTPSFQLIPSLWRLKNRDFAQRPHNTGNPDPDIILLQRALNFYFQGRMRIAEDGYIRPDGETLRTLRVFRQEHGLLPAEKTLLDDDVLQALGVYALLAQRPLSWDRDTQLPETQAAAVSRNLFPEMTANSVIMGLNRLIGRDLMKGQEVPDLSIMALQTALRMWLGPMVPLEIDGRISASESDPTIRALYRFQVEKGLPRSALLNERLIEELARVALGFRP